jgi:predicted negative regulator of RcsB-dependent stress response
MYLGSIHLKKGDHELAISHYEQADVDDDVLRVMAVGNQGDALVELGRVDEAVKKFEQAAGMVKNELHHPHVPHESRCVAPASRQLGQCAKGVRTDRQGVPHQQ